MYFATFETPSPLPHLQRALDELARAGFELKALCLTPARIDPEIGDVARVRIDYCGAATVSPETYLRRLRRLSAVSAVQGGALADMAQA